MSKRLEEIKKFVGILLSGDGHVLLRRKHYEWLIEQAERVKELEEENRQLYKKNFELMKDNRDWYKQADSFQKQNKRLREAIIEAIADIEEISPHEAKKTLREALEGEK